MSWLAHPWLAWLGHVLVAQTPAGELRVKGPPTGFQWAALSVLAVAVAWSPRKDRDDDMRLEGAHHGHHVKQERIVRPLRERFLRVLAEAVVVGACEVLPGPVDAARRQQLLGADHPEPLAQLIPDDILPAVTAREREVRGLHVPPAGR